MDEKGRMGWVLKASRRNGLGSVWLAIGLDVYEQSSCRSLGGLSFGPVRLFVCICVEYLWSRTVVGGCRSQCSNHLTLAGLVNKLHRCKPAPPFLLHIQSLSHLPVSYNMVRKLKHHEQK